MFITFEGIDFSGKTTQVQLLAKYLINKGFRVITLREPGGTEISEKIRQILLEPKNELTSITELFLFEASRSDVVRKVIKPHLEKGSIVICDRFWDSTIAYQGYGRQIPIDFIEKCNFFASEGLEPDITFLLDIDIEIMKRRAKTNIFDRIESEGIEFLKRVANGFRVLAKQYNERIFVIDGSNTIEDIHKKVVEIIENRLKGRDE
ncbi:MAG: Thymidylate kinase [Candidatus Kapaibacterium sp.]|nr:MAG: Thymidylate kinase [Candidatus Kapabacteria bacterium]